MKILHVDDDPTIRLAVSLILQSLAKVVSVEDGQKAWELFTQNHSDYNLIITDCAMPKLSGLQFLLRIQEYALPLRFMYAGVSYNVQRKFHHEVQELGALGLVVKPVDPDFLRKVTSELITVGKSVTLEDYFTTTYCPMKF